MSELNANRRLPGPDFIVIGAPKCGTTSLQHYLQQHPAIELPQQKELHFFTHELLRQNVGGPGDQDALARVIKNEEDYRALFAQMDSMKTKGESSPSYLFFSEVSAAIRSALPGVKLVAILRDPIEKAYSQYMHLVRDQREDLDFTTALREETDRKKEGRSDFWQYAGSSLYTDRLQDYLRQFGRDRLKILIFEDLCDDPQGVLSELCAFLGVDPSFTFDTSRAHNVSGPARSKTVARFLIRPGRIRTITKTILPGSIRSWGRHTLTRLNVREKPPMPESARRILTDYCREDVRRLRNLLSRPDLWPHIN